MDEKLQKQIEKLTDRLAKAKAQQMLKDAAAKRKEKLAQAKANDEARKADAHRKIQLGGLVIAAHADGLDPAEIAGVLSAYMEARNPDKAAALKERGIALLEARKR